MEKKKLIINVCLLLWIGLLIGQKIFYYAGEQRETVRIIYTVQNSYDRMAYNTTDTFDIVKPLSAGNERTPAVILLHGDAVTSKCMNYLKLNYLRAGYTVVLMDVGSFYSDDFVLLNSTLDHLLTRADIDPQRIGIVGHSHGAHYALHFGAMRNDSIRAVVAMNFGGLNMMYDDYFSYYQVYEEYNLTMTLEYYLENRTSPITARNPRNLLLMTDNWDDRQDHTPEEYMYNFSREQYDDVNTFYGNFNDGTARELYLNTSPFGHAAGLFDPRYIIKSVDWMNQALNITNTLPSSYPWKLCVTGWSMLMVFGLTGFFLVSQISAQLPRQDLLLRWIREKLKKKTPKNPTSIQNSMKTEINPPENQSPLEIPKKNSLIQLIQYRPERPSPMPNEVFHKTNRNILKWVFGLGVVLLIIDNLPFYFIYWIQYQLSIIQLLNYVGISGYSIYSEDFPIPLVLLWLILFIWLKRKHINGAQYTKFAEIPIKTYILTGLIAIEMYILMYMMIWLVLADIVGNFSYQINFTYLFFAFPLLLLYNQLMFEFYYPSLSQSRKDRNKFYVLNIAFWLVLNISTVFSSWRFVDALIMALVIGVLNPIIYRNSSNLLLITWFDYIMCLFIWIIV